MTASIKEMILEALDDVGGTRYLVRQAQENPVAFLGLVGKVLPMQIAQGDATSITFLHLVAMKAFTDSQKTIEGNVDTNVTADTDVSTPADINTPALE